MFYLDDTTSAVADAKDAHVKHYSCFIARRLDRRSNCGDKTCKICKSNLGEAGISDIRILQFFTPANIQLLLSRKPAELYTMNTTFWQLFYPGFAMDTWSDYFDKKMADARKTGRQHDRAREVQAIVKEVAKLIDYTWFTKKDHGYYNAYDLAKKLDRNTCTYCNRIYTATVIQDDKDKKKIIRPTFDHWFPKSEFPLLAMSFYNLIPACTNCNSAIKGSEALDLHKYAHPYIDERQTSEFKFDYDLASTGHKYRIFVRKTLFNKTKAVDTLTGMYIDEVYSSHQSELEDLLKIKKNYTKSYLRSVQSLTGGKLKPQELYRMLFGVEYDIRDFHKLPLSKFKFDILKKLNMLDDIIAAINNGTSL
jgi:hypothetical protein